MIEMTLRGRFILSFTGFLLSCTLVLNGEILRAEPSGGASASSKGHGQKPVEEIEGDIGFEDAQDLGNITDTKVSEFKRVSPQLPADLLIIKPPFNEVFDNAQRIKDAQLVCKQTQGRWIRSSSVSKWSGCEVKGQKQGVWLRKTSMQQELIEYERGARMGLYQSQDLENEVLIRGMYADDQKEGYWHTWTLNGQLKDLTHYQKGNKHGPSFGWYEGTCLSKHKGEYYEGIEDGFWVYWHPNGARNMEGVYVKGLEQGRWSHYHIEGNKILEGTMIDGQREGTWNEWLHTGQKWRQVEFKSGTRQGEDELACVALGAIWEVNHKERIESCKLMGYQTVVAEKSYYPNGQLFRRRPYSNRGVNEGIDRRYHSTGELLSEGLFKGGVPEGEHIFSDRSKRTMGRSTVANGNGHWRAYHEDGSLAEEGQYSLGLKVGVWQTYHPGHTLKELITYDIQGSRVGSYLKMSKEGMSQIKGNFKNNRRDGAWVFYYQNGQPGIEIYFKNGLKEGAWTEWYWNTVLKSQGSFVKNNRNGPWREYHNNAQPKSEGLYDHGVSKGEWSFHWYSGSFWRKLNYSGQGPADRDEAVCQGQKGKWEVDMESRKVGCMMCRVTKDEGIEKLKMGRWRWWHANGALEGESMFRDGVKHGTSNTYNERGELILKSNYKVGKKSGLWTGFFKADTPQYIGQFNDQGEEHGVWYTYHPNGNISSMGTYRNGQRVGIWIWAHLNGSVAQIGEYATVDNRKKQDMPTETEEDATAQEKKSQSKENSLSGSSSIEIRTGLWVSWHINGDPSEIGSYKDGKRSGIWRWWQVENQGWRSQWYGPGRQRIMLSVPKTLSKQALKTLRKWRSLAQNYISSGVETKRANLNADSLVLSLNLSSVNREVLTDVQLLDELKLLGIDPNRSTSSQPQDNVRMPKGQ